MTEEFEEEVQRFQKIQNPDDPRRCQGSIKHGQCLHIAIDGSAYCPLHAGSFQTGQRKQGASNYRLTKYKARLSEFVESPEIKSLREEIGILRIILEERLEGCKDTYEIFQHSAIIADLVTKIEKLVSSCHRIEASSGMLLDKPAALALANKFIEIIGRFVIDEDALDAVSSEIINAIAQQKPIPRI